MLQIILSQTPLAVRTLDGHFTVKTTQPGRALRWYVFMLHVFTAFLVSVLRLDAQPYSPPVSEHSELDLDSNWRFIQQDVSGAQASGFDWLYFRRRAIRPGISCSAS